MTFVASAPLAGNTLTVLVTVDDEVRFLNIADWAFVGCRVVLQCISDDYRYTDGTYECFDSE